VDEILTIGFTGDVMIGRSLDAIISQHGYHFPWGNVLPLMQQTSMNIINLETALTHSNKKAIKTFDFKSTPDKIHSLILANTTFASLANNHILDFGIEGMQETIKTMDQAGIKHAGAGNNHAEASAPLVVTKNNIRLGILSLTDNEPGWKAHDGPGINYINLYDHNDKRHVLNDIADLSKKTDFVIVSIHWGPNMQEKPSAEFIQFAHDMIDHGAHIIHGHSAHILQGIECYRHGLILYDTGDFVDDYVVDPELRNDLSAFFKVRINKSGIINLTLVPVRISFCQVNLAREEDYTWVMHRIKSQSSEFNTQIGQDGTITLHASANR